MKAYAWFMRLHPIARRVVYSVFFYFAFPAVILLGSRDSEVTMLLMLATAVGFIWASGLWYVGFGALVMALRILRLSRW